MAIRHNKLIIKFLFDFLPLTSLSRISYTTSWSFVSFKHYHKTHCLNSDYLKCLALSSSSSYEPSSFVIPVEYWWVTKTKRNMYGTWIIGSNLYSKCIRMRCALVVWMLLSIYMSTITRLTLSAFATDGQWHIFR